MTYGNLGIRGLDYSAGTIPGATIKAAGYRFVIRYVESPTVGLNSKHITPPEYRDLVAAGVDVYLVHEVLTTDMLAGHDAGVSHAQRARAGADWIGYPPGAPIFMASDMHDTPAQVTASLSYIDGAISVLGDTCGVYGFWELVDTCIAQSKGKWFWQAGISPDPTDAVHVWQRNDGFVTVGGVQCDLNELRIPLPSMSVPPPAAPTAGPPAAGMDAATLASVMGNVPGVSYDQYLGPFLDGMRAAQINTVNRAAMWVAQLGHESGGLQWMEELASGAEYEGRVDLGNTQPGDGRRYKGRGPIQLTGRLNYGAFSRWCHAQGYVDSDTYFVDNPTLVAEPRWGFLAASWYWVVARSRLNAMADAGDIVGCTRAINGGTNGLADRTARYQKALTFGTRLLPPEGDTDLTPEEHTMLVAIYQQLAGGGADITDPAKAWPGWPSWGGGTDEHLTLVDYARRANVEVRQMWNEVKAMHADLIAAKTPPGA